MEFNSKGNYRGIITTPIAGKKRPVIFVRRGQKISKVATFGSDEDMKTFEMYMNYLLNGVTPDEE